MKKSKNSEDNLAMAVLFSILFGFIVLLFLSHFTLVYYIVTSEDPTPILEYLDSEPDESIRSGY